MVLNLNGKGLRAYPYHYP